MTTAVETALDCFAAEYGAGPGAPLAVLIPALDEAPTVASVVRAVPAQVCGIATEVIVIDDGSSDDTAAEARAAGALVCRFDTNQGQGRAFQAGYRLARERGALFIATLDADGQFDAAELPTLVAPLLSGDADFVNGSRRLGQSLSSDPVRRAGVVVFGRLVSILTGVPITDPANGLRAFRSEVTEAVPLRQPQYQTSEMLIGAIGRGFRVIEVPATMFPRQAGESKKGHNLLYGYRFGRVVLTTWWEQMGRERLHRLLTRRPPAGRR
jgi:glycosyltransferase involved in cell wall biosynthesis